MTDDRCPLSRMELFLRKVLGHNKRTRCLSSLFCFFSVNFFCCVETNLSGGRYLLFRWVPDGRNRTQDICWLLYMLWRNTIPDVEIVMVGPGFMCSVDWLLQVFSASFPSFISLVILQLFGWVNQSRSFHQFNLLVGHKVSQYQEKSSNAPFYQDPIFDSWSKTLTITTTHDCFNLD